MASVLEEHLDYLSLEGRQDKFTRAISGVVRTGDIVADLGCGLGILGILALKAGAERVWGIDQSDAIEIARETVGRLGLSGRYNCIRGSTFRTQLPEQVDVLVCDHIGFFGFDYDIIAMLTDARRRMLRPGGTVVPRLIKLHVAAATGPCQRFTEAWTREPVPPEYQWLSERAANTKHRYDFRPDELCSVPSLLGSITLENDLPPLLSFDAKLEISQDCELHGLAGWFDCELAPGIWITNSPLAQDRINRPNAFLPCREAFSVKTGDIVEVSFKISHEPVVITWTIRDPSSGRVYRHSTWSSTILNPADLITRDARPLHLNRKGSACKTILELADGSRTLGEIEDAVIVQHPDLFPSEIEIRRFVRREVGDHAQC